MHKAWRGAAAVAILGAVVASPARADGAAAPSACTDFYGHANAEWLATASLPPDRSRIGSFDRLDIDNKRRLQVALERLIAEPARQDTPGLRLLASWYASGIDPALADAQGLKPLQPLLEAIDGLQTPGRLPAVLGALQAHGIAAPLRVWVGPDSADVRRHALYVSQGGLGLPDRDDYTRADAQAERLRAAYRRYATELLRAAGERHGDAEIDALMAFEARLAAASMTRVQARDPQATNNRRTLAALAAEAPGFDWRAWLAAAGVPPPGERELVLAQPGFAKAVAALAAGADDAAAATWRRYLRVRLLEKLAPWLSPGVQQAHHDWTQGVQRGVPQRPLRHDELVLAIGGDRGFDPLAQTLGELFAREAFSPQAQARVDRMVEDVRAAMHARLDGLDWMGPATKAKARAKLDAMQSQMGAPRRWLDYGALGRRGLDPTAPAANAIAVAAWATADRFADLDRPVDRTRWPSSPYIVNAFAASLNRIVFPAGILQPPFFDANGDDADNYGAIGMVIGHEIIHHFDDRGRRYDADGNLADWWTPEDDAAYRARAERVVALYDAFEPMPGLALRGRQTLGENISDLGGVQIAFEAFRIAERRAGRDADDPARARAFFTATARIWRSLQRPEALEQQVRTGYHSPGRFRVVAPLAQMPAFARAFGCSPGDPMAAREPVVIW